MWRTGRLQLVERLADFVQMLMREELIHREVVVSPREVRRRAGLLTSSRRARDGIDSNVLGQQSCLRKRKQAQLDACGEATGVRQVLALCNLFPVRLRQAIHIIVVALDAEVLRHIDDLHVRRDVVLLQKGLALAVSEAEEHHIHLIERHLRRERQFRLSDESLMHVIYLVPGV